VVRKKMKREMLLKAGILAAIMIAVPMGAFFTYGIITNPIRQIDLFETLPIDVGIETGDNEDELEWHIIQEITMSELILSPLGEATPTGGGWLAFFLYDYDENPTSLRSNATSGGYDSWVNVTGYADSDNWNMDLKSENATYYVCRVRFNQTQCWNGTAFRGERCRVTLNVTGDASGALTATTVYGNDTAETWGGGMISRNNTGEDYIWINFFWDDNSDGYWISDDGQLNIGPANGLIIEAKY
jgi:hypothetical protein